MTAGQQPLSPDVLVADPDLADRGPADPDVADPAGVAGTESGPELLRQSLFRRRGGWLAIALTLFIVAAGAGAGWQYGVQYRSDTSTGTQVADTVIARARSGAVALLSYSPETLQRDFNTAKQYLTGDFLDYYNEFTAQVVTPAANDKKVRTTAEVTRAAIDDLHPNSAKVLVFINQVTTSADKPEPALTSSSVMVSLDNHGGSWLISGFDPV